MIYSKKILGPVLPLKYTTRCDFFNIRPSENNKCIVGKTRSIHNNEMVEMRIIVRVPTDSTVKK